MREPERAIYYRRSDDAAVLPEVRHGQTLLSSGGLDWEGVALERGANDSFAVDHVCLQGVYVVRLDSSKPLEIEARQPGGVFARHAMYPGCFWVNPAGEAFSHRVKVPSRYTLVELDPAAISALGSRPEVIMAGLTGARIGFADVVLTQLVDALCELAAERTAGASLEVSALSWALAARVHGASWLPSDKAHRHRGGFTPSQQRTVEEMLRASLDRRLTVADLAAAVGMSVARFFRCFRATFGCSPVTRLHRLRILEAQRRLAGDESLAAIALVCGFADQSHFTRMFKRYVGMTPAAWRRSRRRG